MLRATKQYSHMMAFDGWNMRQTLVLDRRKKQLVYYTDTTQVEKAYAIDNQLTTFWYDDGRCYERMFRVCGGGRGSQQRSLGGIEDLSAYQFGICGSERISRLVFAVPDRRFTRIASSKSYAPEP